MFNLNNSKIFSCEIMRGLPENMLSTTKSFVTALEKMLNEEFGNTIDATIQQVAFNRKFGEDALSLDGEIHTEDYIKYAKFSISYDIYNPSNNIGKKSDKVRLTIKDIDENFIFSENIIDDKTGFVPIVNKIKKYLHEKKDNGLT